MAFIPISAYDTTPSGTQNLGPKASEGYAKVIRAYDPVSNQITDVGDAVNNAVRFNAVTGGTGVMPDGKIGPVGGEYQDGGLFSQDRHMRYMMETLLELNRRQLQVLELIVHHSIPHGTEYLAALKPHQHDMHDQAVLDQAFETAGV